MGSYFKRIRSTENWPDVLLIINSSRDYVDQHFQFVVTSLFTSLDSFFLLCCGLYTPTKSTYGTVCPVGAYELSKVIGCSAYVIVNINKDNCNEQSWHDYVYCLALTNMSITYACYVENSCLIIW